MEAVDNPFPVVDVHAKDIMVIAYLTRHLTRGTEYLAVAGVAFWDPSGTTSKWLKTMTSHSNILGLLSIMYVKGFVLGTELSRGFVGGGGGGDDLQ